MPYELIGVGAGELTLSASVGIAVGPRDDAEELLRDAEVAMTEAKATGGAHHVLFESRMHTVIQDRMTLEMDLAEAVEADQLEIVYQPTFDLRTGRTLGLEALLRWRHPTRGLVMPAEFIPIAEHSGLIITIGRWVLTRACASAAAWRQEGHQIGIAVNVSARQIDREGLVAEVSDALRASGLEPSALTLEVTETTIMQDAAAVARRALRPSGETRLAPPGPSGDAMSLAARGSRSSAATTAPAACRIAGSAANLWPARRAWISTLSEGGVTTPSWCRTRSACPAWPGSYCGRLCEPSSWPTTKATPRNSSQPPTTAFRCRALQQAMRSTSGLLPGLRWLVWAHGTAGWSWVSMGLGGIGSGGLVRPGLN